MLFEVRETAEPVMKNRRSQRGIGMALAKYFNEMLRSARTARGNHRNPNRVGDCSRQLAIKADSSSVAIHRRQQDFARSARFRFASPHNRVLAGSGSSPMRERFPTRCLRGPLRINSNDDSLRTKAFRDSLDQCWIGKR